MLSAAFKLYGIFKENSADLSGYSVMDKKVYLLKTTLVYCEYYIVVIYRSNSDLLHLIESIKCKTKNQQ